jgi:hypothetical protein
MKLEGYITHDEDTDLWGWEITTNSEGCINILDQHKCTLDKNTALMDVKNKCSTLTLMGDLRKQQSDEDY